jgi:hypothetical protein
VLTEEQVRLVREANGHVDVVDPQGQPFASLRVLDAADLEALERHRRSRGQPRQPGIPGERVQAFLRKLDELDEHGELDQAKVDELLRRTCAGEPF